MAFRFYIVVSHLGIGHYLSPGGGSEDLEGGGGGNHLIFRRIEGGIIRNREPKTQLSFELQSY